MKVQIPQLGGAAQSIAGRDKGRYYLILGIEGDALLLADGKYRPIGRPKRKTGSMCGCCRHFGRNSRRLPLRART